MTKHYYQVGLGSNFLHRTRLIFGGLMVGGILLTGSAVYAEMQTGELSQKLLQPLRNIALDFQKAIDEASKETASKDSWLNTSTSVVSTSSSQINIQINNPSGTSAKTTTTYKTTSTSKSPSPTPGKTYEQLVQEMNDRAKQSREANDQWFAEQKSKNQTLFEQQSAQNEKTAQDWFEQKTKEGQDWLDSLKP